MERVSRTDITPLVFEPRNQDIAAGEKITFAEYSAHVRTFGQGGQVHPNNGKPDTVVDTWSLENIKGYRESIAHLLPPVVVADRADSVVSIESDEYKQRQNARERMNSDALNAWKRETEKEKTENIVNKTDSSELSGMTPQERQKYNACVAWKKRGKNE